jgi:glycosyltransferase involved in cell wall biosynthesis
MRILVISDLPQFVTGGAEMQAARLIEAWLDAGHEVTCLGRRMGKAQVCIAGRALTAHRIHTTSLFGRWGRGASYFLSLAWLLLQHRHWADIIYTRFLGEAAITTALLKQVGLIRAPLVATPANTHGKGDASFLRSIPFAKKIIRLLDNECEAINLIADDMADELKAAGFSGQNFSHIPNGIPLRKPQDRPQAAMPRFVAVGRLAPQKGFEVLLRALTLISESLQPKQIRIIGDGPERERLEALANDLRVANLVEWLGELTQVQVAEQLALANVFLLPSMYEGFSNAGLEAMERGLPLILTQCGGLDAHVGTNTGWVVPPGNSVALAGAISHAISLPTERLSAMGAHARALVEHNFDIKVTARRYIALFESIQNA